MKIKRLCTNNLPAKLDKKLNIKFIKHRYHLQVNCCRTRKNLNFRSCGAEVGIIRKNEYTWET